MSDTPAQVSKEEQELLELKEYLSSYPKLSKWVELYFDPKNPRTFHNKTEAALVAYDLDGTSSDDRKYANELGSKNARKCKSWIRRYYETTGWTPEKVLDLIAAKAVTSNNAKYVLMLAEMVEVYEEKPKITLQQQIQNNNLTTIQIAPEDQAKLKKEFYDFLDTKYRTQSPALNPPVLQQQPD